MCEKGHRRKGRVRKRTKLERFQCDEIESVCLAPVLIGRKLAPEAQARRPRLWWSISVQFPTRPECPAAFAGKKMFTWLRAHQRNALTPFPMADRKESRGQIEPGPRLLGGERKQRVELSEAIKGEGGSGRSESARTAHAKFRSIMPRSTFYHMKTRAGEEEENLLTRSIKQSYQSKRTMDLFG